MGRLKDVLTILATYDYWKCEQFKSLKGPDDSHNKILNEVYRMVIYIAGAFST